jgi:DNA-binding response OmpR family regulator
MTRGSAQQTIRKDSPRPRVVTEVDINQENELASEHFSATAVRTSAGEAYDDGYLRVEHDAYYVACGGRSIKLGRCEFLIFSRMARNLERVISAEELWRCVWGDSKPVNYESLHVYIYRLRNKLAPYSIEIETMVNVGYRLLPTKSKTR